MSAGIEPDVAEEFLYATLRADGTLMGLVSGVFSGGSAPQATAYPLVILQHMSGQDTSAVGAFRIWTDLVYLVKVVGETADYQSLRGAVGRIDALLHRASGTAADGTIWACVREQTIRLAEIVQGQQYRHAGALYRVYAS